MERVVDTVAMIDNVTPHENTQYGKMRTNVGEERNELRNIIDFLKRPESLKSIDINTNTAFGSILARFEIPSDVLPQMKRDKLVGFKNFSADTIMHFKPSTNPFVSGKVIFFYFAPNEYVNGTYKNSALSVPSHDDTKVHSMTWATGCPHIIMDLSSGEPIEFKIPYLSAESHWDMTIVDPSSASLVKIPTTFVVVVAAYTDLWVDSPISIQNLVSLDNIDLSYPTFPTREIKGMRTKIKEKLVNPKFNIDEFVDEIPLALSSSKFYHQGVVSTVASAVDTVAKVVGPLTTNIPVVGSVIDAIGSIAGPIADIAGIFGFSKPVVKAETLPVEMRLNPSAQNVDGNDSSRVFALFSTNQLSPDDANFGTSLDQMSFAYMFGRYEFIDYFKWKVTDKPGSSLWKTLVTPLICDQQYGVSKMKASQIMMDGAVVVPTHLSYLGHMFWYWRGTLKYKFSFAKTAFHVGRVRVMWLPGDQDPNYDPNVNYSSGSPEASYFIQKIVDLRDENEVEMVVPFASNRPFNLCEGVDLSTQEYPNYSSNGIILVQALTQLSAPSTVAPEITCVVSISVGDDFDYSYFKGVPWSLPVQLPNNNNDNRISSRLTLNSGYSSTQYEETYGGISFPNKISIPDNLSVTTTPESQVHVLGNVSVTGQVQADINGPVKVIDPVEIIVETPLPVTVIDPVDITVPTALPVLITNDTIPIEATHPIDVVPAGTIIDKGGNLAIRNFILPDGVSTISQTSALFGLASKYVLPTEFGEFRMCTTSEVDNALGLDVARVAGEFSPEQPIMVHQSNLNSTETAQIVSGQQLSSANSTGAIMSSFGEVVKSIRSLINVFSYNSVVLTSGGISTGNVLNGFTHNPQCLLPYNGYSTTIKNGAKAQTSTLGFNSTLASFSVRHTPDILDAFSLMYGFWKGSVRTKVVNMHGGCSTVEVFTRPSWSTKRFNEFGTSPIYAHAASNESDSIEEYTDCIPFEPNRYQVFIGNDVEARNVQLQIPYYTNQVMSRITEGWLGYAQPIFDAISSLWTSPSNLYTYLYSNTTSTSQPSGRQVRLNVYRAAADDYQFIFLQGIPPVYRTDYSRYGYCEGSNPLTDKTLWGHG